jgi:hypothetical protein
LGVGIERTKQKYDTRRIRLAIGSRGIKQVKNSPPRKLKFSITIKEHQPRQVGIEKP